MITDSTQEALCLHLVATESASGPVSTPDVLDALGVGEGAVTSHFEVISGLAALEQQGYIETRRETSADGEADWTVYELTEAGREHARNLEEQLADREVSVATGTGQEVVTLVEAAERLDGSLAEAVARLQDDVLVVDDVEESVEPEAMPFVGREAELAWLDDQFERARSGDGRVVYVEGEPGVGKTYLATEFGERVVERDGAFLYGQAARETETPYGAFLEAVARLQDDDRITSLLTAEEPVGSAKPEALEPQRESLFAEVADELASVTADRPVVLALDDAQWLDRPTALLVAHLVSALDDEPFMVLVASYPVESAEGDPLDDALGGERPAVERRTLGPFDAATAEELVCRLVGTRRVPEAFVDGVRDRTGGNPLFVTESVTLMLEEGVVQPAAGLYPETAEELLVPASVEESIRARLDGLDDRTRRALAVASLIGTVVPEPVMYGACDIEEAALRNRLELLVESRLWDREDPETVRFVSDVVRETVRETVRGELPDEDWQDTHRRIARAYQEHGEGATAVGAAAHHYDRAGDTRAAIDTSLSAAENAIEVYAHEVATEACERAVDRARDTGDDETVVEALTLLGDTYETLGEFDEATRCFRYVRERTDDPETVQWTWTREGRIETKTGNFEAAGECLEQALDLLADRDAPGKRVEVLNNLGIVAVKQSDFGTAREYFREASEVYRDLGDRLGEAKALGNLGVIKRKQGNYQAAREAHHRSLDMFQEAGETNGEANALGNLGLVAMERGDLSGAREFYERCLDRKRAVDDPRGESRVYGNLGTVERLAGNLDAAREYHQQAIDIQVDIGDRHGEAQDRHRLGTVERVAGNYGTARTYYRQSLETVREMGDPSVEAAILGDLGILSWLDGQPETATEYLDDCLAIYDETGEDVKHAEYLGVRGAVEISQGDVDSGRAKLDDVLATLADTDDPLTEVRILRHHAETELERGDRDRARDRCEQARDRIDATDAELGAERDRIERLREQLQT